jgi:hypothetical protein
MTPRTRGLIVAGLQIAIVCSLAGKFYVDRVVRPRTWVRTVGYDPEALIRGRYVSVRLAVEAQDPKPGSMVRLDAQDGRLVAVVDHEGYAVLQQPTGRVSDWSVGPVAVFIPEHVPDPTIRKQGEELWAEVTVPRRGLPRAIRLGVKRGNRLEALPY